MAPSGEGAGRNEQEKEGRKSIDFLKGGTGQDVGWGGIKGMMDLLGLALNGPLLL